MRKSSALLTIAALLMFAGFAGAQEAKFGHIDLQGLIQVMPERTAAEAAYNKEAKGLEDQMGTMQQELENKYKEYVTKRDSLSDIVRSAKETDIQDLQQRIQNFSQVAQQQLQQKQAEMLRPIFEKAQKAVADVAKEKGLIYVFDVSGELGTVLYRSNESLDLLPLVKTKLGIK
ncbi:MAG: OmpH family outer membrane protein [Prolixibacteraceae bacterium]|jgi:outer membrane protein|nr:OmpH family outer membrane protein [Prolixibacteraceae bacterium]NLX27672.1 OmpH family outer membrane protein [Bacteroidales bacterium]HPJ78802.1 OmpH family outer membrane protein [Prolixibacteraceae bacterium]HRV89494.1 OmpH family outer membrane protein [Prolixibacteraceae bacterium]